MNMNTATSFVARLDTWPCLVGNNLRIDGVGLGLGLLIRTPFFWPYHLIISGHHLPCQSKLAKTHTHTPSFVAVALIALCFVVGHDYSPVIGCTRKKVIQNTAKSLCKFKASMKIASNNFRQKT